MGETLILNKPGLWGREGLILCRQLPRVCGMLSEQREAAQDGWNSYWRGPARPGPAPVLLSLADICWLRHELFRRAARRGGVSRPGLGGPSPGRASGSRPEEAGATGRRAAAGLSAGSAWQGGPAAVCGIPRSVWFLWKAPSFGGTHRPQRTSLEQLLVAVGTRGGREPVGYHSEHAACAEACEQLFMLPWQRREVREVAGRSWGSPGPAVPTYTLPSPHVCRGKSSQTALSSPWPAHLSAVSRHSTEDARNVNNML